MRRRPLLTNVDHVPPLDYDPASDQHNLAASRGLLALLYGADLELTTTAGIGSGPCDDCQASRARAQRLDPPDDEDEQIAEEEVELFHYGRYAVCRLCALKRRRARDLARIAESQELKGVA